MYIPSGRRIFMNTIDGKAQFFAFISHKNCDSAIALRLQKFIESYRLPTEIRKETGAPKYLAPICSYEIDFSSNPLKDEMDDKLSRSHYLILLCSKDLIKNNSHYVNYEIKTFINTKREQGIDPSTRIIPIIIDGEFDSPEEECCPDELKALGDKRPIAINLKQYKSNREAFLHIISGMLDIDFAVLERRDKKITQKRKFLITAAACILIIVSCFLGEYFIPRSYHYLDFAMKNGLPIGIERLSADEYSRVGHYVITYHKHKITSLEYVNKKGNTDDLTNSLFYPGRPAIYDFDYNSGGLNSVTLRDKNKKAYFIQQYSANNLNAVDFKDPADPTVPYYIVSGYESDPSTLISDPNIAMQGSTSRFQYEYTPDGYISRLTFHRDSSGMPAEDSSVYGFEYATDEMGRIIEIYYLDALGNRRLNSEGIYCKQYVYDQSNNPSQIRNLNESGNLTPDRYGVYSIVAEYNENHQLTSVSLRNEDGSLGTSEYYAYSRMEIDPVTNIRMFFDENKKLISDRKYCGVLLAPDQNGYSSEYTYLDENKLPVMTNDGYSTEFCENDQNGNPIRKLYFDTDKNPVNTIDGYAEERISYNDIGLVTERSYYDKDGNRAEYMGYGYSVQKFEYDEFGRETCVSYFDTELQPVNTLGPSWDFGYHKLENAYLHGANTKISVVYYDKDNNRTCAVASSMGELYSEAVIYTQNGVITSMEYFDKDGNPWGDITEYTVDYTPTAERVETANVYNSEKRLIKRDVNTYNLLGVSVRVDMTEYGESGSIISEASFFYTDAGKRKSSVSKKYTDDGALKSEYSVEYNENEKAATEILITPDSYDSYKFQTDTFYYPDSTIQKEESASYDYDGGIRSRHNVFYDTDGIETVEERSFYKNGTLTTQTQAKYYPTGTYAEYTNISYDSNGLESHRYTITYDTDSNELTNHTEIYTNGEKIVAYTTYNKDGSYTREMNVFTSDGVLKLSDVSSFDANGNPLQ